MPARRPENSPSFPTTSAASGFRGGRSSLEEPDNPFAAHESLISEPGFPAEGWHLVGGTWSGRQSAAGAIDARRFLGETAVDTAYERTA